MVPVPKGAGACMCKDSLLIDSVVPASCFTARVLSRSDKECRCVTRSDISDSLHGRCGKRAGDILANRSGRSARLQGHLDCCRTLACRYFVFQVLCSTAKSTGAHEGRICAPKESSAFPANRFRRGKVFVSKNKSRVKSNLVRE